jgi:hypothetical protein
LGHQYHPCYLYRSVNSRSWRSAIAVPDAEINWSNFWKMTLQRRRGKSPLAIESIDDRYCRSPRGVMPLRGMPRAAWHAKPTFLFCREPRLVAESAMNAVAACAAGAAKFAQ